jgi:Xaa-Pro aminopeptidase
MLMRPGAVCEEIYTEIDRWAAASDPPEGFLGYGENRAKFLGHGVGLTLDELPVLAGKVSVALEPGMILAVEPKAVLSGIGPVGAENTYLITDTGCESLCRLPEGITTCG